MNNLNAVPFRTGAVSDICRRCKPLVVNDAAERLMPRPASGAIPAMFLFISEL